MRYFILVMLVISVGCSTRANTFHQEHSNYLQLIKQKEKSLTKNEYQIFLTNQIKYKENHLFALQKEYANIGELEKQQQSAKHGSDDIQNMNLRSSQINLHNMNDQIQLLQKQIFFLKSKLSSSE